MKYFKFIFIIFFTIIVFTLEPFMFILAYRFRYKARDVVHGYNYQNKIWIYGYYNLGGYKNLPKVSYSVYLFYKYVIWIWLNDFTYDDTYNLSYFLSKKGNKKISISEDSPNNLILNKNNKANSNFIRAFTYMLQNHTNNFILQFHYTLCKEDVFTFKDVGYENIKENYNSREIYRLKFF